MKIAIRLMVLLGACAVAASAQASFPDRAITFIVPFPPGGSTDTPARIVAEKMATALGQSVIVMNRAGASGQIGVNAAARAHPDGYTMVLSASATHTLPGVIGKKLPYDPIGDFRSVGTFVKFPLAVVGNIDLPPKSIKELLPYVRDNANKISIGVASTGSVSHFSAERFLSETQARPVLAHYQGDSAILSDLIGGVIQLGVFSASSSAPLIQAGKVRGYIVAGNKRYSLTPDVPTVEESGMPGALLEVWYGISVPAGTPDAAIQKLNQALKVALDDPSVVKALNERGFEPNYSTPEKLDQIIVEEPKEWQALMDANNIKIEQ